MTAKHFNTPDVKDRFLHLPAYTLLFTFCSCLCFSQPDVPDQYLKLVERADSLYRSTDFLKSAECYSSAFKILGWKGRVQHRYLAACSWALAGHADSAFMNLERIVSKAGYDQYYHIKSDEDLASLNSDEQWKILLSKVKQNRNRHHHPHQRLIDRIDSLVSEDQRWRRRLRKYENRQPGTYSFSADSIQSLIRLTDSLNHLQLKGIFSAYGFPNYDLVGEQTSQNFWLLMQHQDNHPEFQELVLARMKTEADKGKASVQNYAYLLDRVKVNTGQLQVYGTQMKLNDGNTSYEPEPMVDPEKINERRKSVGLGSMESYIRLMNQRYFGTLRQE